MKQYKKFNAGSKYSGAVRNIAVNISIADIMSNAEEGMKRVADEAGMSVITAIMEGERQRLLEAGSGYRHGSQPGYICLNGRKVAAESLRVRSRTRLR